MKNIFKKRVFDKLAAISAGVSLILNIFLPLLIVIPVRAEEIVASPSAEVMEATPTPEPNSTPELTPTPEATPTLEPSLTPTKTPENADVGATEAPATPTKIEAMPTIVDEKENDNNDEEIVSQIYRATILSAPQLTESGGQYTLSSTSGIWTSVSGGTNITGLNTNEIRWGRPVGSQKSGLRFDGKGQQSFNANETFLIGDFTHFNWATWSGSASGATLKVTLNFSNPAISPSPTFSYNFGIEETANKDRLRDCKYYGTDNQISQTPCDDIITFPNGGYGEEVYQIGDMKYTLKIDGFKKSYPDGATLNKFVTEEEKNNIAYLVGHLSSILMERPAISIVKKVNGQDANTLAEAVQVNAGETVNFTYIVQNTGNVKLTNIAVTDDKGVNVSCPKTELDAGTNMTCTGSATAIAGNYTNIGTVTSSHDLTASDPANYKGIVPTIRICHASNSQTNPYIVHNPSASGDLNGHAGHTGDIWFPGMATWGDIIPPFTSYDGVYFPGLNWSEYGQAVYNNNCVIPQGKIIVNKVLSPASNDNTEFTITGSGTPTVTGSPTFLYESGSNIGSISRNKSHTYNVMPGTYDIAETVPAGWKEISNTCSNISITNNETKYCTITNSKGATLTLIKTVINDNGGIKQISDFNLYIGDTKVTSGVANQIDAGTYTVREDNLTGYNASNWGGDCRSNGEITLSPGDNKTCTITNDDIAPTLKLVKSVTNDNGGTLEPKDWTLTATGENGFSDLGNSTTFHTVKAGVSYALSESDVSGYTSKGWQCDGGTFVNNTIKLDLADKVTCTVTNDDIAPHLTLIKNLTDIYDSGLLPSSWTLSAIPASGIGFSGTTGVNQDVTAGMAYTLSESGPTGTIASQWDCNGGTQSDSTITLDPGQNVICTITNTTKPANLIIRKVLINDNGGTKTYSDFSYQVNNDPVVNFEADGQNELSLSKGIYSVRETTAPGYTTTYDNCDRIDLNIGETQICTITNNDVAPSLQLVKVVDNKYGGNAKITDWNLKADGPTSISGDGGVTSGNEFKAGTYTLSESGSVTGYNASDWSCTNNIVVNENNQITLGLGQSTKCTITNTEIQPTLKLVKTVVNNHGGNKKVSDFNLYIGDTQVNSDVATKVNSGEYIVREDQLVGYTASDWGGDCSPDGKVTLKSGENKTCTITNSDSQSKITVIKKIINDNGGTKTVGDFDITLTDSTLTFDAGVKDGDTTTYTASVFGNVNQEYTLSEIIAGTGYTMDSLECSLGTNGVFTLPEGQDVTCTIVNNDIAPKLTLNKIASNTFGGNKAESDWTLYAKQNGVTALSGKGAAGDNDVISSSTFKAGSYTLSEEGPTGYTASAWTCTGTGSLSNDVITLGVGQESVCSITNSDQPAGLTVIKKVINDNDGDATINDFEIKLNNDLITFGNGITEGTTTTYTSTPTVSSNTQYSLSEKDLEGYEEGDWNCLDNNTENNVAIPFTLSEGQNVTCTVTNDDIFGQISVIKFNDVNGNGQMDAGEETLPNWQINLSSQDSKTTDDQGSVTFNKLIPQTYYLSETMQPGWTQTSINCGQDQNQVKITAPGEAYGHHGACSGWNGCGDAATCAKWACEAKGYQNLVSYGEVKGCTKFNKCNLFNSYNDVDYNWDNHCDVLGVTDIVCSNPNPAPSLTPMPTTPTQAQSDNNYQIVLDKSKTVQCYIGNRYITPKLTISKSNNVGLTPQKIGNEVEYTLKLKVTDNMIKDLTVVDLPPEGFNYKAGSYQVKVNGIIRDIAEPQYHSPGKWSVGDLNKNDEVELTYIATIQNSVDPGTYKDAAWAFGCQGSTDCQISSGDKILAEAVNPGYLNSTFVGTQVRLVAEAPAQEYSVDREEIKKGEVLGATTGLPATGANNGWLWVISSLLASGMALVFAGIKKNKIMAVILALFMVTLFIPKYTLAANSDLFIALESPASPNNQSKFDLAFTALDMLNRPMVVKCFKINPDNSEVQLGGNINLKAGGNSGNCSLESSPLSENGKNYRFYAVASSEGDTYKSEVVSVDYNTDLPGVPTDYSKEKEGGCRFKLSFRASNDGKTKVIRIYRSEQNKFNADGHTQIGEVGIDPGQWGSFTDVNVPDCNKTYYYAIRAFDGANNGSGLVGDSNTIVTTVTSTTTTTVEGSTTETTGAIRVTDSNIPGEEEIANAEESAGEESETSGEGSVLGTTEEVGKNNKIKLVLGALILIAIIVYVSRRSRHQK